MNEFLYNFLISFGVLMPAFALVSYAGLLSFPWRKRLLHLLWLSAGSGAIGALIVSLLMLDF